MAHSESAPVLTNNAQMVDESDWQTIFFPYHPNSAIIAPMPLPQIEDGNLVLFTYGMLVRCSFLQSSFVSQNAFMGFRVVAETLYSRFLAIRSGQPSWVQLSLDRLHGLLPDNLFTGQLLYEALQVLEGRQTVTGKVLRQEENNILVRRHDMFADIDIHDPATIRQARDERLAQMVPARQTAPPATKKPRKNTKLAYLTEAQKDARHHEQRMASQRRIRAARAAAELAGFEYRGKCGGNGKAKPKSKGKGRERPNGLSQSSASSSSSQQLPSALQNTPESDVAYTPPTGSEIDASSISSSSFQEHPSLWQTTPESAMSSTPPTASEMDVTEQENADMRKLFGEL